MWWSWRVGGTGFQGSAWLTRIVPSSFLAEPPGSGWEKHRERVRSQTRPKSACSGVGERAEQAESQFSSLDPRAPPAISLRTTHDCLELPAQQRARGSQAAQLASHQVLGCPGQKAALLLNNAREPVSSLVPRGPQWWGGWESERGASGLLLHPPQWCWSTVEDSAPRSLATLSLHCFETKSCYVA